MSFFISILHFLFLDPNFPPLNFLWPHFFEPKSHWWYFCNYWDHFYILSAFLRCHWNQIAWYYTPHEIFQRRKVQRESFAHIIPNNIIFFIGDLGCYELDFYRSSRIIVISIWDIWFDCRGRWNFRCWGYRRCHRRLRLLGRLFGLRSCGWYLGEQITI